MKYLPLIWAALSGASRVLLLTLVSIIAAFVLSACSTACGWLSPVRRTWLAPVVWW